jgi:hypothetical protein
MKFTDTVHLGEIVLWYKAANVTKRPFLAMVTDSYVGGMVDLVMIETREVVKSVRHKTNDYVQMRNGVMNEGTKETGCWDFRSDKQKKEFWPESFKKQPVKAE